MENEIAEHKVENEDTVEEMDFMNLKFLVVTVIMIFGGIT